MRYLKIYIVVFIFAIFAFSGVSHQIGQKLSMRYSPLLDAAMVIKLEVTRSQLQLNTPSLKGDINGLSFVKHLERADRYARAMAEGGSTEEWEIIPVEDEATLEIVKTIQAELRGLGKQSQAVVNRASKDKVGAAVSLELEKTFLSILEHTDEVEENLQVLFRQSLGVFNWLEIGLQVAVGLMGLALFWVLSRFERQSVQLSANAVEEAVELAREMAFLKKAMDEHAIISSTDRAGRINAVNEKFCEISGYTEDELMGKNHRMLKSDEHPSALFTDMWGTISSGHPWHGEIKNIKKNGGFYWVKATIVPFMEKSGKPFKYISIRTDITKAKAQEKDLEKAVLEAYAATEAKSNFLANMSHEIRTPMNAIMGMSYLALQTNLSVKQQNYLEKVHSSAKGLLGIINDILDFSKIEANKMEIEAVPFSLDEVVQNLITVADVKAQEKGIIFEVKIDEDVPKQLIGDPLRLGQILLNLANNGIKFTEQGQVCLHVRQGESTLGADLTLLFEVRDSGIGMTPEQQERLFHSFSQADTSTTRKYGGTGLGLSIAKTLTELMGGEIWVESELGQGSQFFVTIQLKIDSSPSESACFYKTHLAGLRVLVLDDSASARHILEELAHSFGLVAESASIGLQALKMIEDSESQGEQYDLFIVDWQMAGMDGPQTLEKLQVEMGHYGFPAVVMVSGYDVLDMKKACVGLDVLAYLSKPVVSSEFYNVMLKVSRLKEERCLASTKKKKKSYQFDKIAGAKILLVEDNLINQEVALGLLEQLRFEVVVANHGQEALDILDTGKHFDCVLMDMQMPVLDGYETSRKIRESPLYGELPIIAMTAHAMSGDKEKCIEAGANDHCTKPIDPDSLFEQLCIWVPEQEALSPVQGQPLSGEPLPVAEVLTSQTPQLVGFEVEKAIKRIGGKLETWVKVLGSFLAEEKQVQSVGQIRGSLDAGDVGQAKQLIHSLKGAAGNIGAVNIAEAAATLEDALRQEGEPGPELLEGLDQAMGVALSEVENFLQRRSKLGQVESLDGTPSAEPVANIWDRLFHLKEQLDSFDSSAKYTIAELLESPQAGPLENELNQINQSLNQYEFEKALEVLMPLLNSKT